MLSSVTVTDYKIHEDTALTFAPGVNVLIGHSDAGKSALLQSILWSLQGLPRGDSFIRKGSKGTTVCTSGFGFHLCRSRRGGTTETTLEGPKTNITSHGKDVPPEVPLAIPIFPINIHRQFDGHFLLSWTAGERASYINELAHLEEIDTAQSNVNASMRKITSNLDGVLEEIDETEATIKKIEPWLLRLEGHYENAKMLDVMINNRVTLIDSLQTAIGTVIEAKKDLAWYKQMLQRLSPLAAKANLTIDEIGRKRGNVSSISIAARTVQTLVHDKNIRYRLLLRATPIFQRAETLCEKINQTDERHAKLSVVEQLMQHIITLQERLQQKQEEFSKYMPNVCPLCDK